LSKTPPSTKRLVVADASGQNGAVLPRVRTTQCFTGRGGKAIGKEVDAMTASRRAAKGTLPSLASGRTACSSSESGST
jgi:hypothetical protein